jgi:tRNA modification GTPase
MEKTRERLGEADLFLLVLDASNPGVPADMLSLIRWGSAIVVLNKSDLVASTPLPAGIASEAPVVRVSALTGLGWEHLVAAIVNRAEKFQVDAGDEVLAINARHAHALTEAREALQRGLAKLRASDPIELLASDLRAVLAGFGEIVGRVDNERMLDHLFASFCIGK